MTNTESTADLRLNVYAGQWLPMEYPRASEPTLGKLRVIAEQYLMGGKATMIAVERRNAERWDVVTTLTMRISEEPGPRAFCNCGHHMRHHALVGFAACNMAIGKDRCRCAAFELREV